MPVSAAGYTALQPQCVLDLRKFLMVRLEPALAQFCTSGMSCILLTANHTPPEKTQPSKTPARFVRPLLGDTLGPQHGGMETPKKPAHLSIIRQCRAHRRGHSAGNRGQCAGPALPASSAPCSANRQTKASTQDSLVAQRLRSALQSKGARVRSRVGRSHTRCNRKSPGSPHSRACAPRREGHHSEKPVCPREWPHSQQLETSCQIS